MTPATTTAHQQQQQQVHLNDSYGNNGLHKNLPPIPFSPTFGLPNIVVVLCFIIMVMLCGHQQCDR
jgi:hypothetical protein